MIQRAHIAVRVFRIGVCVRVPKAPAAHAHALPSLLADHHLRCRRCTLSEQPVCTGAGGTAVACERELGGKRTWTTNL